MLMLYEIDQVNSLENLCVIFAEVLRGIHEVDVLQKAKFAIIVVNLDTMLNVA